MKLFRPSITLVCFIVAFVSSAGEQPATKTRGAVNRPPHAQPQVLHGTWEGVLVGDKTHQKITLTIAGSSLHFHRDTNFWFGTTIALPAGTNPQQLHATIKEGSSGIGNVVVAIYKIEGGTLILATGNGDGEAPKSFEVTGDNGLNRYEFTKVQLQKKGAEPIKTK